MIIQTRWILSTWKHREVFTMYDKRDWKESPLIEIREESVCNEKWGHSPIVYSLQVTGSSLFPDR